MAQQMKHIRDDLCGVQVLDPVKVLWCSEFGDTRVVDNVLLL